MLSRLGLLVVLLGSAVAVYAQTPPPLVARQPALKGGYSLLPDTPIDHVVIKFQEGAHVRLREGVLVALDQTPRESDRLATLGVSPSKLEADLDAVQALLASSSQVEGFERLFTLTEEALATLRSNGETQSRRELADLDLYYRVRTASGATYVQVVSLLDALNDIASVEIAYAAPPAASAVDIPPVTPDFESGQGYLDAAPSGIDARYAWTLAGGRGAGVKIVDVEGAWRTSHEDLPSPFYQGGVQVITPASEALGWRNHGTAVLGEMVASDNGYGVTGIANQAQAGIQGFSVNGTSQVSQDDVANAIANAAVAAGVGGLVLIELHTYGTSVPNPPGSCCGTTCDFVPEEFYQGQFDAIATATANARIVVEAGGNGSADLDHPNYNGIFNRSVRDSGAILVGASNPGDRSPACFTNFGSRIDVHGWGSGVHTLGYGNLFNGNGPSDEDQFYTSSFGGTSSASPIVTGAAAVLQGVSLAAGRGNVSPLSMRNLLRDTGTPQAADSRQIGPLPDLHAATDQLLATPLNAQFVAQSVPAAMVAGEPYAVSLTIKNTGTETWSTLGPSCNSFRLRSINPTDNTTWGLVRIDIPAPLAPGETATLDFTVTAPSAAGIYNFQWRALKECVAEFGIASPNVAVSVSARQQRDVRFLSKSVPTTMVAGQSYAVSLTLRNSGSNSWTPIGAQCNAYRLGSANPQNNTTWGLLRAELPATVPAGGEVTVSFTVTAPAATETYNFQWQMVQECVTWFGNPSPNVPVTVRGAAAKDAQVLEQTVPKIMVAGKSYSVTVKVKNVGTQVWNVIGPQCNAYRLGAANPQGSTTWGTVRAELAGTVATGQVVTLSFTVTAPAAPGTYNFQWQMVQECVTWFGDPSPNVVVTVRSGLAKDAQVLEQTVPKVMVGNQTYPVSLKVKNVGTQAWDLIGPQCSAYRLGGANPLSNTTWGVVRVELPATVAPGQEVTLAFNVVAPPGTTVHNFQWQMVQECVTWFGDLSPSQLVSVMPQ